MAADNPTTEAAKRKRETRAKQLTELQKRHDSLRDSLARSYEAAVAEKREQHLAEWEARREQDLARLKTEVANLALPAATGGRADTGEVERLQVMTSKEVDAAVRSQIASAPDASILPLASHRPTDRALLDRLRREIERMRGEVLLNPHEVKAVQAERCGHVSATNQLASASDSLRASSLAASRLQWPYRSTVTVIALCLG
jgi:hypothetical protein